MNGQVFRHQFVITNPQGFHMRPITAFAETACKFQSNITVTKKEGEPINGKSPLSLIGLGALQGTELVIEVNGPDAAEALPALLAVLSRTWDDE